MTIVAAESDREEIGRLGVQSAEVAASILDGMAMLPGPAPLKAIADQVLMHPSKLHRYLKSLVRARLVVQDPTSSFYSLGPLCVKIGLAALRNVAPVQLVTRHLPALRDRLAETAVAAVWGSAGPTVIAIEEAGHTVTTNVRIGSVLPVTASAVGLVFASWLEPSKSAEIAEIVAREFCHPTASRPLTKKQFKAAVEVARSNGFATLSDTLLPGTTALAAPLLDYDEKLVCVAGIVGPSARIEAVKDGEYGRVLCDWARTVSAEIGHSGWRCEGSL